MSNYLEINLVEFKNRGSDQFYCGIVAEDDEKTYIYRSAESWEKFKSEFPSIQSIVDHVTSQDEFSELAGQYTVDGSEISFIDEDLYTGFDGINIEGVDGLYE